MDKNLQIVVFASVVVLVLIGAGIMLDSSITGAAIEGCLDTDGNNPNVAGQVKIGVDYGSKPSLYYDRCSGSDAVIEMICRQDKQETMIIPCPNGCVNGACN